MKAQINLIGGMAERIDGIWGWFDCEYSLNGKDWHEGMVQSDGHLIADETLLNENAEPVPPNKPDSATKEQSD